MYQPYLPEGFVAFVVADPVCVHEVQRGSSALGGQQLPLRVRRNRR